MRRLLLLAVVIFAVVAVSAAGAETTVQEQEVFTAFPVCMDGVVADFAYGTVTQRKVTVSVVNENRTNVRQILTERGALTGLVSGAKYQYSLTWPLMWNYSPIAGEQARYTAFLNATVVGPGGPGNVTQVGQLYTALISGNGELVVERTEPLATECK